MMLRELHEVMTELQEAMAPLAVAAASGLRLTGLAVDLPLDMSLRLRGGGCVLLADLPRNLADASWQRETSRLRFTLAATPVPDDETPAGWKADA